MKIFAHRGNFEGINKIKENSIESIRHCLENGWGIETDIRRTNAGKFYISHDPGTLTEQNDAKQFCSLFRDFPDATIALNVKELGYEKHLIDFLHDEMVISQVFLFDMELLEKEHGKTAILFYDIDSSVQMAARISDKDETIDKALSITCAKIIWADEFDTLWLKPELIERIKDAGKMIYAISPEIHGFPLDVAKRRWQEFRDWGIDGICTDYSIELDVFLKG